MPDILQTPPGGNPAGVARAARWIREGRVVVFPTTGLYGLGADAENPRAVRRVFEIKNRPPDNPILVLISERESLLRLARRVPEAGKKIMDAFWPGRVTLVLDALATLPEELTAGTGKIGVRMALHPVARALVRAVGGPVTGTSANVSGAPAASRVRDLDPRVSGRCAAILDAGELAGGVGSTIVDVTGPRPVVLRQGAVSEERIQRLF